VTTDEIRASFLNFFKERGHTVELVGSHEETWGPVSAIDCGHEMKGSADPRISTSAALAT
jgi:hypothetical protein